MQKHRPNSYFGMCYIVYKSIPQPFSTVSSSGVLVQYPWARNGVKWRVLVNIQCSKNHEFRAPPSRILQHKISSLHPRKILQPTVLFFRWLFIFLQKSHFNAFLTKRQHLVCLISAPIRMRMSMCVCTHTSVCTAYIRALKHAQTNAQLRRLLPLLSMLLSFICLLLISLSSGAFCFLHLFLLIFFPPAVARFSSTAAVLCCSAASTTAEKVLSCLQKRYFCFVLFSFFDG